VADFGQFFHQSKQPNLSDLSLKTLESLQDGQKMPAAHGHGIVFALLLVRQFL